MSADAGTGQVLQHRHAQAAAADDEHSAAAQLRLTRCAHFLERHLARVVRHRGLGAWRDAMRLMVARANACRVLMAACTCSPGAAQRSQFTQPESPFW